MFSMYCSCYSFFYALKFWLPISIFVYSFEILFHLIGQLSFDIFFLWIWCMHMTVFIIACILTWVAPSILGSDNSIGRAHHNQEFWWFTFLGYSNSQEIFACRMPAISLLSDKQGDFDCLKTSTHLLCWWPAGSTSLWHYSIYLEDLQVSL